jgi:hypothetical protein
MVRHQRQQEAVLAVLEVQGAAEVGTETALRAPQLKEKSMSEPTPNVAVTSENSPDHIMQFFAFAHLPTHMQAVSSPFCDLANVIVATMPRNPERTVALRKLLEAKDAAVRAFIAK